MILRGCNKRYLRLSTLFYHPFTQLISVHLVLFSSEHPQYTNLLSNSDWISLESYWGREEALWGVPWLPYEIVNFAQVGVGIKNTIGLTASQTASRVPVTLLNATTDIEGSVLSLFFNDTDSFLSGDLTIVPNMAALITDYLQVSKYSHIYCK